MNREKLIEEVAERLSSPIGRPTKLDIKVTAHKILAEHVVNIFIDCEISVSSAKAILEIAERIIANETIINKEAKSKEFFV